MNRRFFFTKLFGSAAAGVAAMLWKPKSPQWKGTLPEFHTIRGLGWQLYKAQERLRVDEVFITTMLVNSTRQAQQMQLCHDLRMAQRMAATNQTGK